MNGETKKELIPCLHKNVVITEKNYYRKIEGGYYNAESLEEHHWDGEQVSVYCQDCDTYIE